MNDWLTSVFSTFGLILSRAEIDPTGHATLYSVERTIDLSSAIKALAIAETLGLKSVELSFGENLVSISTVDYREYVEGNLSKVDFLAKWQYGGQIERCKV